MPAEHSFHPGQEFSNHAIGAEFPIVSLQAATFKQKGQGRRGFRARHAGQATRPEKAATASSRVLYVENTVFSLVWLSTF